jgi:two-component system, OmpR family, phosphate regulon sensor histidine kinase PhoR
MSFWWRPVFRLSLLGFACLILWATAGGAVALVALVAGLLLYILHHLRQLKRLIDWLARPMQGPVPEAAGSWDDAFYGLHRLLRTHRTGADKLSATLERFQQAALAIPDGIVLLDKDNRIDWCNPAATTLGLDDARDRGQFVHYILRDKTFSAFLADEGRNGPLVLRSPSGRERVFSLQLVPLGEAQRMLISRDITELENVDAMRRDFVANVSHELRTPITVVGGFMETFAEMENADPKVFAQYIGLMREQTDRMRRIVEDLLALSRIENEENLAGEDEVNVPELAQSLLREARSLSQDRHRIHLEIDCLHGLRGDNFELSSAFSNLISNAVRYTPAGGEIWLRWECRGDEGWFSVKDTGEGIAPEHVPRLTERFYRVDRGRSRETGGTGLGLAIVKHVLQRHQARMVVESIPGRGSTFSAVFPAHRLLRREDRTATVQDDVPSSREATAADSD